MVTTVDTVELETKVKEMYRHVAQRPAATTTSSWAKVLPCASGTTPNGYGTCPPGPSNRSPASASSSTSPT